jgi:hypothetical protein
MFLRVTLIAAAAIATTAIGSVSPANAAPPLQPGPHSALADVDLPEGTVQCTSPNCLSNAPNTYPDEEWWAFRAPYDDVEVFLQTRFATGRRYDTHGATWWNGLPPCYNTNHQSPPWGWTTNDGIWWMWSDGAKTLSVLLGKPGVKTAGGDIVPWGTISILSTTANPEGPSGPSICYRA